MWFQYINLAVLLIVIVLVARKKLNTYFRAQHNSIQERMTEAAQDLEKIQNEYKEIKSKVDGLQTYLSQLREGTSSDLDREVQRIRRETESFVDKLRGDSELRMQQDLQKAKKTIEAELVEIAMAKARMKLESKMSAEDQKWTSQMLQADATMKEKNYAS